MQISTKDSVISFKGKTNNPVEIVLTISDTKENALNNNNDLLNENNLFESASEYWNNWISEGKLPSFKNNEKEAQTYIKLYKQNLYVVKSANLNGMIPADMTGQFLTNNMPQLYPRDAMMCARVFMETGHPAEARKIIEFWAQNKIPKKSKGEFYARYDAYAKAVDAGAGARYDEPEWDANGYFIHLVDEFLKQKDTWLADKSFIYQLADFIVNHIDESGLLYEGGIVEWTGYLPATNMICASALKTASKIA